MSGSSDDHNASPDDTIGHRTLDVSKDGQPKASDARANITRTTEMQRPGITSAQTIPEYMPEPDMTGLEVEAPPRKAPMAPSTDHMAAHLGQEKTARGKQTPNLQGQVDNHVGPDTKRTTQKAKIRVASPDQVLELPRSPDRSRLQLSAKPDRSQRSVIRARLVVVNPPEAHVKVYLDSPDLIIGRGREAHLILMDDGASRLHARFERHDAGFRMLDLDSGNGTFINGRRIQYAELYDGDLIAIGRTRIRFESVGWSRLPEERPSFVQTVLTQTFKNVPRTSMWPALVVAFCVGLVVVATMNIAGTTTGPSNAEMITQRVEQAEIHMANARWNDAKQEIVFARLLDTKSEKLKKLQLTLEQRTIDEDTHRLMGDYLRDGREVSTIEKLKKTISEQSPVASKAEALLLKARQVQAERYYVRAKRHFMAGRLQEAQSSAKKAVASDGRHKMSQNLLKSVMSEIQKR